MAGRKVFTSGEILTAADVNSFLMDQSVMVFADSSARSSAIPTPSEGMVTYVEDANRVEVYDGAAFGPIGGILQVVSTTKTDTFSTNSTSFSDVTGLSATITPSSASSKIFVLVDMAYGFNPSLTQLQARLMRDSTPIRVGDSAGSRSQASASPNTSNVLSPTMALTFLDSPATTSSVTYNVEILSRSGTTYSVHVNRTDNDSDSNQRVRSASTITLMEVAV